MGELDPFARSESDHVVLNNSSESSVRQQLKLVLVLVEYSSFWKNSNVQSSWVLCCVSCQSVVLRAICVVRNHATTVDSVHKRGYRRSHFLKEGWHFKKKSNYLIVRICSMKNDSTPKKITYTFSHVLVLVTLPSLFGSTGPMVNRCTHRFHCNRQSLQYFGCPFSR